MQRDLDRSEISFCEMEKCKTLDKRPCWLRGWGVSGDTVENYDIQA
jgi:hypothetical protein